MKFSLRFGAVRGMATRRPERPQPRFPDPLSHVEGVKVGSNLTFFHRPPPSAPSPESLTTAPSSPLLRTPAFALATSVPPPLAGKLPAEKKYHLNESQINEIRRLRSKDPVWWTRSRLAKKFGTTSWFISTVSRISKERRNELDKAVLKQRESWGELKRTAVEVRQKRREFW